MRDLMRISRINACVAFRYRHLIEYIQCDLYRKSTTFSETFNKKLDIVFIQKTEERDFINHD